MPRLQDVFGGPDKQFLDSPFTVQQMVEYSQRWWEKTGRHVIRNPEFKDQDIGFNSGILLGREFHLLTVIEQSKVMVQYWKGKLSTDMANGLTVEQSFQESDAGRAKKIYTD